MFPKFTTYVKDTLFRDNENRRKKQDVPITPSFFPQRAPTTNGDCSNAVYIHIETETHSTNALIWRISYKFHSDDMYSVHYVHKPTPFPLLRVMHEKWGVSEGSDPNGNKCYTLENDGEKVTHLAEKEEFILNELYHHLRFRENMQKDVLFISVGCLGYSESSYFAQMLWRAGKEFVDKFLPLNISWLSLCQVGKPDGEEKLIRAHEQKMQIELLYEQSGDKNRERDPSEVLDALKFETSKISPETIIYHSERFNQHCLKYEHYNWPVYETVHAKNKAFHDVWLTIQQTYKRHAKYEHAAVAKCTNWVGKGAHVHILYAAENSEGVYPNSKKVHDVESTTKKYHEISTATFSKSSRFYSGPESEDIYLVPRTGVRRRWDANTFEMFECEKITNMDISNMILDFIYRIVPKGIFYGGPAKVQQLARQLIHKFWHLTQSRACWRSEWGHQWETARAVYGDELDAWLLDPTTKFWDAWGEEISQCETENNTRLLSHLHYTLGFTREDTELFADWFAGNDSKKIVLYLCGSSNAGKTTIMKGWGAAFLHGRVTNTAGGFKYSDCLDAHFVCADEWTFDTTELSTIKEVLGGEPLSAAKKFQNQVTSIRVAKWMIASQYKPTTFLSALEDDALRNRMSIIEMCGFLVGLPESLEHDEEYYSSDPSTWKAMYPKEKFTPLTMGQIMWYLKSLHLGKLDLPIPEYIEKNRIRWENAHEDIAHHGKQSNKRKFSTGRSNNTNASTSKKTTRYF